MTMATWVALIRGINVGGRRKLAMADLRTVLASLGHEDVTTYVQSGNAVFRATGREAAIADAIEAAIGEAHGLDVAVLLRTPRQLRAVAARRPFGGAPTSELHVVFLDRTPTASAARRVDPDRSPPDEFRLHGRELYLRLPAGAGRTKLTLDYLERQLGVRGTHRNWNTVTRLAELAAR